ncbi:MAG TPA: hypothetical protein VGB04_07440 [Allosphingosinicella sp.]|jgi:hypothetical protein
MDRINLDNLELESIDLDDIEILNASDNSGTSPDGASSMRVTCSCSCPCMYPDEKATLSGA